MTERKVANLRAGQRVQAALGVKYVADDAQDSAAFEGMELLFDGYPSILLSCDTNWNLRVTEGQWPDLPAWCWPPESWTFEKIEQIGRPGLDIIISTSDIVNSVGEVCGVLLDFPMARVTVKSGEALTWEIAHKE